MDSFKLRSTGQFKPAVNHMVQKIEYSYRSVILSFVCDIVCVFTTILLYFSQCSLSLSLSVVVCRVGGQL